MENDEGILNHIVLDTSSAVVILEKLVWKKNFYSKSGVGETHVTHEAKF